VANYYGVVATSGGQVKKGKEAEARAVLDRFSWPDLEAEVTEDGFIQIWGEADGGLCAYKADAEGNVDEEDDYENRIDEAMAALAPLIETPLIVSEAGHEKCRYVAAHAYVVKPGAEEAVFVSLDAAIAAALKD